MSEGADMSDRDGLAAEYVLGTLPLPERLQAERLIASDPSFAALVADWQARLAPLNDGYAEISPPPDLLPKIEARLFPAPAGPALWRLPVLGALAAGLAALILALYLPFGPAEPTLTATLSGENQPPTIAAAYYADDQELTFTRTAGPAAEAGKDYELWVIPAGQAPISLGIIREQSVRVALASLPAGSTLAVTLETSGGSPTGAPQGPLLIAATIGEG